MEQKAENLSSKSNLDDGGLPQGQFTASKNQTWAMKLESNLALFIITKRSYNFFYLGSGFELRTFSKWNNHKQTFAGIRTDTEIRHFNFSRTSPEQIMAQFNRESTVFLNADIHFLLKRITPTRISTKKLFFWEKKRGETSQG